MWVDILELIYPVYIVSCNTYRTVMLARGWLNVNVSRCLTE